MSRELIESIVNGDYVSANELFEQKLSDIREKKLYESKRMLQAETVGTFQYGTGTPEELRARGFKPAAAELERRKRKAPPTPVITKPKGRPGIIKRNINTLMGRDPGYVKPEKSPEQKEMERGGKLGKGLRLAGKGVGKAWGAWGNILQSGMSGNLEE